MRRQPATDYTLEALGLAGVAGIGVSVYLTYPTWTWGVLGTLALCGAIIGYVTRH